MISTKINHHQEARKEFKSLKVLANEEVKHFFPRKQDYKLCATKITLKTIVIRSCLHFESQSNEQLLEAGFTTSLLNVDVEPTKAAVQGRRKEGTQLPHTQAMKIYLLLLLAKYHLKAQSENDDNKSCIDLYLF